MTDTITVVGIVGTDPERRSPNGLPITTFRVGSPQRRFDRTTGAWVETGTNWYTVSAYRQLAEHAFQSLRKKDRVILTGRLRVRKWETGESKGTAVDIDLDAIGHDLLFGTTVYTRDAPSAEASPQASHDSWATAEAGGSEWARPGLDSGSAAEAPERSGEDYPAAPAPQPLALAGAEAPF